MASDSRQSVTLERKTPEGKDFKVETVNFDAAVKTFLLEKQRVGIVLDFVIYLKYYENLINKK